jgi:transcriptional regulator with XRE-family HTH domain
MSRLLVSMSERTVPLRLPSVNSVVTVDTVGSDTSGARLRAFIDKRWTRRQGGIKGLAAKLGISTETMYEWFRDEREPNLDHLTRLGEALSVSRYELVAAMDGELVARVDDRLREMMLEVAEEVVSARLGPARSPRAATH